MRFFVDTAETTKINWLAAFLADWATTGQQIA